MKKLTNLTYLLALIILVFCPIFAMIDNVTQYSSGEDNGNTVIEMLGNFKSI